MRQLEHIASGGELACVMLALKLSVEAGADPALRKKRRGTQRTMVFDEIDTGIGAASAESVGKKLSLARSNQVLCVTHLPQIATFADHHYVIEKKERNGRTRTGIRLVGYRRRTHRGSSPHAEWRQTYRYVAQARRTDDQGEHVASGRIRARISDRIQDSTQPPILTARC